MNLEQAIKKIINDGIEAVNKDYQSPDQKLIKESSIAGFEACRGKNPAELKRILENSQIRTQKKMLERANDYLYYRGFSLEVEWICNVVSAILMNQGLQEIITPTARGIIKAGEVVGVSDK